MDSEPRMTRVEQIAQIESLRQQMAANPDPAWAEMPSIDVAFDEHDGHLFDDPHKLRAVLAPH